MVTATVVVSVGIVVGVSFRVWSSKALLQTRHNFVGEIRIFSMKIRINPYPSFMHRCIAKTFTRFISRCSLQQNRDIV